MTRFAAWIAGLFVAAGSQPVSEIDFYYYNGKPVVELWTRGEANPVVVRPTWDLIDCHKDEQEWWLGMCGRPIGEVEKELR